MRSVSRDAMDYPRDSVGGQPSGTNHESIRCSSPLSRVYEDESGTRLERNELENGEEADEWALEEHGLYSGSYSRLLAWYSLVPATAIITLLVLIVLPLGVWPLPHPSEIPHSIYFSPPLPEILLSSSIWCLSYMLRLPIYTVTSWMVSSSLLLNLLSSIIHVSIYNLLRLASLPLLQVRHFMECPLPSWQDPAFRPVWWLGLNFAEVIIAVVQGYSQIILYRDVLVPTGRAKEFLDRLKRNSAASPLPATARSLFGRTQVSSADGEVGFVESQSAMVASQGHSIDQAMRQQIDKYFDQLVALKTREELEEVYGVAVIKIPVFISCLQRLNSIVVSLALTLLMSAGYLGSQLSYPVVDGHDRSSTQPTLTSNRPFYLTFALILFVHSGLTFLHTPVLLPRIGVHTAAYITLIIGLMCFFGGLAMWGALS